MIISIQIYSYALVRVIGTLIFFIFI